MPQRLSLLASAVTAQTYPAPTRCTAHATEACSQEGGWDHGEWEKPLQCQKGQVSRFLSCHIIKSKLHAYWQAFVDMICL